MKELGEGSYLLYYCRGVQGGLNCLPSADTYHCSKDLKYVQTYSTVHPGGSTLKCHSETAPQFTQEIVLAFSFSPPTFCRFTENSTARPVSQTLFKKLLSSLSTHLIISVLKLLFFVSLQSTYFTITKYLGEFSEYVLINFWTGNMEQNQ